MAGELEAESGIYDPLEAVNRGILVFNDAVDAVIIKPAAKLYGFVAPEFAKRGVRNFVRNLNAPVVLANDLLQFEGGDAAITVGRFVVNTVFGVAGFAEVAEGWNLPHHPADFGQTLHGYGSGPGAYLMLPILGPSTVRDGIGTGVDTFFHPFTYLFDTYTNFAITGGKALVRRETLIVPLDDLRASSIDYYAALRSAYFQDRAVELNKGAPSASPEVDRMFEEFE
jgi:phospholipid-binding lipoprotein MlaA